jgi:hypothetical protein
MWLDNDMSTYRVYIKNEHGEVELAGSCGYGVAVLLAEDLQRKEPWTDPLILGPDGEAYHVD